MFDENMELKAEEAEIMINQMKDLKEVLNQELERKKAEKTRKKQRS